MVIIGQVLYHLPYVLFEKTCAGASGFQAKQESWRFTENDLRHTIQSHKLPGQLGSHLAHLASLQRTTRITLELRLQKNVRFGLAIRRSRGGYKRVIAPTNQRMVSLG